MKTFQLIISFALIAASMAFAPNQSPQCKSSRCQSVRKELREKPSCSGVVTRRLVAVYNCINNRHRFNVNSYSSDYLLLWIHKRK